MLIMAIGVDGGQLISHENVMGLVPVWTQPSSSPRASDKFTGSLSVYT